LLTYGQNVFISGQVKKPETDLDFTAKFEQSILPKSHVFGIGVVEKLKGNVIILDGKLLKTSVKDTFLKTDTLTDFKFNALIYSEVSNWRIDEIEAQIDSLPQLASLLVDLSLKKNTESDQNLVFMIRTHINNIGFNVIDWLDNEPFDAANPKQYAHTLYETDTDVLLIGFMIKSLGQAINQKSDFIVYVATESQKPIIVGSVDSIEIKGKLNIYLPQKQNSKK
jgi:hypothetical protein